MTFRLALAFFLLCGGCRVELGPREETAAAGGTVRVYSSMYKEVIDAVEPVLARKLGSDVTVEWFQSGSEKVASRLDAELASGGSPCDLLLTSDPSYYARLKADGRLVPYVSPAALKQPREFVDRDGAWATARVSTMVVAARGDLSDPPESFGDLARPGLRATLGDPLSSGTFLTSVGVLSARLGWDWFAALKKKGTVASGGNASVLTRIESGEADAGMLLLENVLTAKARGSRVKLVIPKDGAIAIPGNIALLTHAKRSASARLVYDALLSDDVQRVIVAKGNMHSADPMLPPPDGAPSLESILGAPHVEPDTTDAIKKRFDEVFYR